MMNTKQLTALSIFLFIGLSSQIIAQTFNYLFATPGNPHGILLRNSGTIFVSQTTGNAAVYTTTGTPLFTIGSGLMYPIGIASSALGNTYVADYFGNQIYVYDSSNNLLFQFGSTGTGNGQFNLPHGVSIRNNKLYIADFGNNRIQVFDLTGNYISQFGSTGTGNGEFQGPCYIAWSSIGTMNITDRNNSRVQVFDSTGNYLNQFGTLGSGNGEFTNPNGITIDNYGNIFVGDVTANRVQMFDSSRNYLSQFGTTGNGNGQFNQLVGLTTDNTGNIFVSDYANSRVQVFSYSITHVPRMKQQIYSVYPNPLISETTFKSERILKNATFSLYNSYGQKVREMKNISGQSLILSRNHLKSGLYFFRLTEENQNIAADKLIITDK